MHGSLSDTDGLPFFDEIVFDGRRDGVYGRERIDCLAPEPRRQLVFVQRGALLYEQAGRRVRVGPGELLVIPPGRGNLL